MKYNLILAMLAFLLGQTVNGQSSLSTKSYYVPAVDGTKLAVDVHFPSSYENQKLPALFEFTRYWRSSENPETGKPNPSLSDRD